MNTHPCHRPHAALLALTLASPLLLSFAGCASAPAPVARMAVAEAAVQNATSTSADAPGELLIATNKLAGARQAATNKDFELAGRLADEAQVDAQVAELHAQSTRSRKAAQESRDAARVLLEELNRKTVR